MSQKPSHRAKVISTGDEIHAREALPDQNPTSQDAEENLVDALLTLRRLHNAAVSDSSFYSDTRLHEWLAREARETAEQIGEDLSEERVFALTSRLRAIVASAKCRLRSMQGWPEYTNGRPGFSDAEASPQPGLMRAAPCLDLSVAAGTGRDMWDEECENSVVLPDDIPLGKYVALRISGDSMAPLIHDGDVILVKLSAPADVGCVVVARTPDQSFVVKRVLQIGRGEVELGSVNPAFPSIRVPLGEQGIVGSVVLRWCGHTSHNSIDYSVESRC